MNANPILGLNIFDDPMTLSANGIEFPNTNASLTSSPELVFLSLEIELNNNQNADSTG